MKRECIVCGSKTVLFGQIQGFLIYKCPSCGLGITENIKPQPKSYHRDGQYYEEETLFKNIFSKRVNLIAAFSKNGKALEIGCSTGLMLSLLEERGWDVTGVEISKNAANIAKDRGIRVVQDYFENFKTDEKYDLVILNHTLEHLDNPKDVIKKITHILKPNGYLYIDLPNFDSLSAKLLKIHWSLLLPAEHRWHFTFKSIGTILGENKFTVEYLERSSGIWDYNQPFLGVINSLKDFKKRFFSELLTAIPSFIISKLGLGTDLLVIAKKMQ